MYYQIIHNRLIRQINSEIKLTEHEWANPGRAAQADIRADMSRINRVVTKLKDSEEPFSADDIVRGYRDYMERYSVFAYLNHLSATLKSTGRIRTSETYRSALNSFRKFREGSDVMLDRLDSPLMERYEGWLRGRGVVANTVSFYMRILRAAYNRAVEEEAITDQKPFRRVYTGIDKTIKRALPIDFMRRIRRLDLSRDTRLDYARDIFILSFQLRGMSFVDMAYLKKSDVANRHLTYRRRKTGQPLKIRWTGEMDEIVKKYPANKSEYLLPIIRKPGGNPHSTYRNMSYNINRSLKKIAGMVGVEIPLTLYVARHSWASAAKAKGVPLSVISEGMGHDSETTTQIYLASLDTTAIDKANDMLIDAIK